MNVPLAVVFILLLLIYNYIYSNVFIGFKESLKFSECFGYAFAKWFTVSIITISLIRFFTAFEIISFDFRDFHSEFMLNATIICATVRVVSLSLFSYAHGRHAKLRYETRKYIVDSYYQEKAIMLVDESLLNDIPEEYWSSAGIQKLINIITENKLISLSEALHVLGSHGNKP